METITVFKDSYNDLCDREFKLMTQFAELHGQIIALSKMDDSTDFVMTRLKEIVKDLEKNS
jgi:translation elongation factor EF-1alpha